MRDIASVSLRSTYRGRDIEADRTKVANNYSPGDEIFLVGFSRGAFTARSIAGLMGDAGLLTKSGLTHMAVIFKDFQQQQNPNYDSPYPNIPFPNKPSANDPAYASELERVSIV